MTKKNKITFTKKQTLENLRYFANSPPQKYGGFDETIILTAKVVLQLLKEGNSVGKTPLSEIRKIKHKIQE